MIGYVSVNLKHDVGAASSVNLAKSDLLSQHFQGKPPSFNTDLLNGTQTPKNDN